MQRIHCWVMFRRAAEHKGYLIASRFKLVSPADAYSFSLTYPPDSASLHRDYDYFRAFDFSSQ